MTTVLWRPDAQVSSFFQWREFAVSDTHPELVEPVPDRYRAHVIRLARDVWDPIRSAICRPVRMWSGYRSHALNAAIGGSPTSQHCVGEAGDGSALQPDGHGFDPAATEGAFLELVSGMISVPCGQVIYYPNGGDGGGGHPFIHAALPSMRFPSPAYFVHDPAHGYHYQRVHTAAELAALLAHLPRPAMPDAA